MAPVSAEPKTSFRKNWDTLASQALDKEGKEKSLTEDPNVGGDAAVNSFFQQIYANADEETQRAMLKSYTESGGTALSTDWKEVCWYIYVFITFAHGWENHHRKVSKGKVS
jgi:suppressor of G2 allele of SKP1